MTRGKTDRFGRRAAYAVIQLMLRTENLFLQFSFEPDSTYIKRIVKTRLFRLLIDLVGLGVLYLEKYLIGNFFSENRFCRKHGKY